MKKFDNIEKWNKIFYKKNKELKVIMLTSSSMFLSFNNVSVVFINVSIIGLTTFNWSILFTNYRNKLQINYFVSYNIYNQVSNAEKSLQVG